MITCRPNADMTRLLIAARRVAYGELHTIAADRGITVDGVTEAEYSGDGRISINGIDLRPMINAIAIETMVQIGNPDKATSESARPLRYKRAALWLWEVPRRYIARRRYVDWTGETRAQSWRLAANEFHRWVWGCT